MGCPEVSGTWPWGDAGSVVGPACKSLIEVEEVWALDGWVCI